jgi:hypothetical protein
MPKAPASAPLADVRLLRLTPDPDQFVGLTAHCLSFPYEAAAAKFTAAISTPRSRRGVPIRQLNNLLLACLPTLAHGFEGWVGQRRLLVVGTPTAPLALPDPAQIHELVCVWAKDWAFEYRDKHRAEHDQFLAEVRQTSPPRWYPVSPDRLVRNPSEAGGLIYQAIPALLASLLHGQTIHLTDTQQELHLRKVQGGGGDRTGLYVVSQPFKGFYQHEKTTSDGQLVSEPREGYFAYRLDFDVQTQAGRQYAGSAHLKPWVFLRLSCQRYAHEALTKENFKRGVSLLTSLRTARLDGAPFDSTLVRLQIGKDYGQETQEWQFRLPRLLREAQARPLVEAEKLLVNPSAYGIALPTAAAAMEEYYLVHAEGYGYGEGKRTHAIRTGFHLDERREIVRQVLELLGGKLLLDEPLPADAHPLPKGSKIPAAMRPLKWLHGTVSDERRKLAKAAGAELPATNPKATRFQHHWQHVLQQAKPGSAVQLLLVYHEASTLSLMQQQVRKALLLPTEGELPSWLHLTQVLVKETELMAEYAKHPASLTKAERKQHYARLHTLKRQAWEEFLRPHLLSKATTRFAFLEAAKPSKDVPRQIKGAVREACAKLGLASQLLRTVNYRKDGQSFTAAAQSRCFNAALDLLVRQTGVLGGPPSATYEKAGLPASLATSLDVVALYRRQVQATNLHYALAVRLRATGEVEVLLPQEADWLSYSAAGPRLGSFLAKQRTPPPRTSAATIGRELTPSQLAQFAARVVAASHERPTLMLIEAEVWRNAGKEGNHIWPQLKNEILTGQRDELDFRHVHGHNRRYTRTDEALHNLLGVVRLRMDGETPQYLPEVIAEESARDFEHLSGFIDHRSPELWHYFSVGKAAATQKVKTDEDPGRGLFKLEIRKQAGASTSFRHQQVVEMVPFFVRPDLQNKVDLLALCRVPHYLRASPAWATANTLRPFPLHLAHCLLDDYLCILN